MYKKFIKYVTYPLWTIKDGNFGIYKYIREYGDYDKLSYDELIRRQNLNLKEILIYAYENCEYYRDLFDLNGFAVHKFHDPEMMKDIPILTKELIRNNLPKLVSKSVRKDHLFEDRTGGSSGVPLMFYRDKECLQKRRAQELFFDRWIGYDIGDKIGLFVAAKHMPHGLKGFRSRFRNETSNRFLAFDPGNIDDAYMEDFLVRFRKHRPDVIKCFPNSLYIFAKFLKKKGVDDIVVKSVSCTGETLHDYQKELFKEVFHCPVFEKYASFEVGVAACECREHDGMHMFLDGVYFEFLNERNQPAGPGELASIVVTDLFNRGMPFIRYKIGDTGVYSNEKCRCGSNLPILKKLHGRDRDILVDERGNPKPGYLFVEVFNKNNIQGKFQVIQESAKNVRINVVRLPGYEGKDTDLIQRKFGEILGASVHLNIEFVEDIPREASGKYMYVKSKVSPFS